MSLISLLYFSFFIFHRLSVSCLFNHGRHCCEMRSIRWLREFLLCKLSHTCWNSWAHKIWVAIWFRDSGSFWCRHFPGSGFCEASTCQFLAISCWNCADKMLLCVLFKNAPVSFHTHHDMFFCVKVQLFYYYFWDRQIHTIFILIYILQFEC